MIIRSSLNYLFTRKPHCVLCKHAFSGKNDADHWNKVSPIRCTGFGENPLILPTNLMAKKPVTTTEENSALSSNRYARKIVASPDKGKITDSTFPIASQVKGEECPFNRADIASLSLRLLDLTVMSLGG